MTKKQLWESKLAQRGKHLKEAYDDFASAIMSDGTKIYVSASTRHTKTYNYEDVEFEFGAKKGHGTYRWMNRPWQRFDFASALQSAMIDAGVDKEFARECIDKSGSLRSAVEYFAKNYKSEKKEIEEDFEEELEDKYTLFGVEVGILISKEDDEFEYYANVYDEAFGDFGYYDENIAFFDNKEEAIAWAKDYVEKGVKNTYGIVSDLGLVSKEIKIENGNIDDGTEFMTYKADDVIKFFKKQGGKVVEVTQIKESEDEKLVKGFKQDAKKNFYDEEKENKLKVGSFEFCVMDKYGNNIDCFVDEEDAIMFAKKKSNADRVLLVKYGPEDEYKDRPELSAETIWSVNDNEDDDEIVKESITNFDGDLVIDDDDVHVTYKGKPVAILDNKKRICKVFPGMTKNAEFMEKAKIMFSEFTITESKLVKGKEGALNEDDDEIVKEEVEENKTYQIQYWLSEEDREEGFSDILIDTFETKEEAIQVARKMIDRDNMAAAVEVFNASTDELVFGYDGIETWRDEEDTLKEARGAGKGQKLDRFFRLVGNLHKDNLSKEEIARLEKARAEVERFEPTSEYEKKDKKNLLQQIERVLKDGKLEEAIDLDKHVWEGWTVQDFIDELEPLFDQIMSGRSWQKPFKDKAELKAWCIDNQPYYKRYIPGVVEYFFKKMKKNENLNEKLVSYDPKEWEPEDIELHKSINWKERDYEDFAVPEDSFETEVVAYGLKGGPQRKTVKVVKHLRANPIYPPYYRAIQQPFKSVVGPMFNGHKHEKYSIHDRYETQEYYNSMSESKK